MNPILLHPLPYHFLTLCFYSSQPSNRRYSKHIYHMANGDGPPSIQSTYKRLPFATMAKRTGQASMELESHERSPLKVVKPQFRPMTYQMVQNGHQSAFLEQLTVDQTTQRVRPPGPVRIQPHAGIQTMRTVSENDLYLLGAIEKLVYRVDYLESRIRRTEQMIYYLMSGSNQKEGKTRKLFSVNVEYLSKLCNTSVVSKKQYFFFAKFDIISPPLFMGHFLKTSTHTSILVRTLSFNLSNSRTDFFNSNLCPTHT